MKRVNIHTPGKILSYRDILAVRTPTSINIEDKEIEHFKTLLDMHGIDQYTIEDNPNNVITAKGKKIKRGLKKVHLSGAAPRSIKFNVQ